MSTSPAPQPALPLPLKPSGVSPSYGPQPHEGLPTPAHSPAAPPLHYGTVPNAAAAAVVAAFKSGAQQQQQQQPSCSENSASSESSENGSSAGGGGGVALVGGGGPGSVNSTASGAYDELPPPPREPSENRAAPAAEEKKVGGGGAPDDRQPLDAAPVQLTAAAPAAPVETGEVNGTATSLAVNSNVTQADPLPQPTNSEPARKAAPAAPPPPQAKAPPTAAAAAAAPPNRRVRVGAKAPKVKRQRKKTQPFQYNILKGGLDVVGATTASTRRSDRYSSETRYYRNEFLALRSQDGFFICQLCQSVTNRSKKIKIRWLSRDSTDGSGEIYVPDFYDVTDVECILTNVKLSRESRHRFRLPAAERDRTDAILRQALAAERGEPAPPSIPSSAAAAQPQQQQQQPQPQAPRRASAKASDRRPKGRKRTAPTAAAPTPKPAKAPRKSKKEEGVVAAAAAVVPKAAGGGGGRSRAERAARRQNAVNGTEGTVKSKKQNSAEKNEPSTSTQATKTKPKAKRTKK